MLAKEKRLNLKKEFSLVAAGKKVENDLIKLFFRLGDGQPAKVGVAVSSKAFPKATSRNRARRLVSRGFEVLYTKLEAGVKIVAIPKKEILSVKSDEVATSLRDLLTKADLVSLKGKIDEQNNHQLT